MINDIFCSQRVASSVLLLALFARCAELDVATDATPSPDAGTVIEATAESTAAGSAPKPSVQAATIASPLPCDVRQALQAHCWQCHGKVLQYTAPIHLVSLEDFRAPSAVAPGSTIAQRVKLRIHDQVKPMPPAPNPALSASDLSALDSWIEEGATRPGPPACEAQTATMAPVVKTSEPAPPAPDPNLTCTVLRAHGLLPGSAFPLNQAHDLLECFGFNAPWGNKQVYGVSFKPVIDNTQVVHHMLLHQHSDNTIDGSAGFCTGLHADSALMATWAPGTGANVLPADVAIELPPTGYTLELHYNGNGSDQSGFEVCYSDAPRVHTAGMHMLGTTNFNGTTATGVCRPTADVPIHTLKHWPHMHLKGRRMTLTIQRASGETEVWHDAPFEFASQLLYDTDKVILPGDTITTTCQYGQPAKYGERTSDEMCFDVVLAYPVGALTQPGGVGSGHNQCIETP